MKRQQPAAAALTTDEELIELVSQKQKSVNVSTQLYVPIQEHLQSGIHSSSTSTTYQLHFTTTAILERVTDKLLSAVYSPPVSRPLLLLASRSRDEIYQQLQI